MSAGTLEGQVAIVTGGGRGLGRAMVLGLAAAGVRVIATAAREATEIEKVAVESGDSCIIPMIADVTNEQDCANVVGMALKEFGRLDLLGVEHRKHLMLARGDAVVRGHRGPTGSSPTSSVGISSDTVGWIGTAQRSADTG